MPHKIILASNSPRRKQLLGDAGYAFEVHAPAERAECGICSRETPPELTARLAYQKAADVALRLDQGLVLGCDTVAECLGRVLGKPHDRDHAREMLRMLRGREHRVYSGVCLWERPSDRRWVEVDVTKLIMSPISDAQLEAYLHTNLWEGKAGAFGYQDGIDWIRILAGSESNVVGLPMERLAAMLARIDEKTSPSPEERRGS